MKKRTMLRFVKISLVVCGFALMSLRANASPTLSGTITELFVNDGGHTNVVFISVGTSFTSSCGATSVYLAIDLSAPSMKEAYAMALSALMSGRTVNIGGIGNCY